MKITITPRCDRPIYSEAMRAIVDFTKLYDFSYDQYSGQFILKGMEPNQAAYVAEKFFGIIVANKSIGDVSSINVKVENEAGSPVIDDDLT